jgi:hypothetical protein
MFSHIIDFAPTPPPATPSTIQSDGPSRAGNPPALAKESGGGFLTGDGKLAKEKHVRWTPSTLGNGAGGLAPRSSLVENEELRVALEALETNVLSPPPPSGAKKGPRSRASSLLQSGTVDRKGKGKGKERAVEPEPDDDFTRYLKEATQDLAQMRG